MSDTLNNDVRPWYRDLWPWALMLPPAAAVMGGIVMVYLSTSTPNSLVVDDYSRIEEITSERFARDARAAELGLAAELVFEVADEHSASVNLTLHAEAFWEPPRTVTLHLMHAVDGRGDTEVVATRFDGRYIAEVDLLAGRYEIELTSPDRSWRLGGSLTRVPGTLRLSSNRDAASVAGR